MQMRQGTLTATASAPNMTSGMIALFAFCCGAIVANLYYAQPIIGLIAPDIGMSPLLASLIVSLTQIGYALGLFFLVPLADLVENRRLMIVTASVSIFSLAAAALTTSPNFFLAVSLLVGFSSVSVQIMIPLAAHLSAEANRGRVVGGIMSGLLLGILLARPFSSYLAGQFGWRTVFTIAAILMACITVVLAARMPTRETEHKATYVQLLRSLGTLAMRFQVLRQRAFFQGCMFASFSLFWTAVPLELARVYGFSQAQIAVFCLVGAIGAVAAPVGGRLADAGHTQIATMIAIIGGTFSYLSGAFPSATGFIGLAITGILLDFFVQMNMVLGQREIYALDAASRGRLNALYMTSIFVGGATGSSVASVLYNHGGWMWIVLAGSAFPLLALAVFLMGKKAGKTA